MQLVADKYIRLALEEDIHSEDVSTNAVMPEYKAGEVELICKQDGVIFLENVVILYYNAFGVTMVLLIYSLQKKDEERK